MDKTTLRQYRPLVLEIEQIEEQISRLGDGLIGAVNINDMPHSQSKIHDSMAEVACKMADLAQVMADKLNVAIALRIEIEQCIDSLEEPSDRALMRYRYVDGKTWNRINECLYGSNGDFIDRFDSYLRTVFRQHGRILQKLK